MKRRQHEVKQSFLHLEELGVIPRHSTKRPIRKTFQKYKEKKGSPIKYNPDCDIQKKFDLEVMAFLVNSNLHYSFVETKGFRHFVAVTNPQYNIRSSRSMSKRMTGLAPRLSTQTFKQMALLLYQTPVSHQLSDLDSELLEPEAAQTTTDNASSRSIISLSPRPPTIKSYLQTM
jgi:hypothetical protein